MKDSLTAWPWLHIVLDRSDRSSHHYIVNTNYKLIIFLRVGIFISSAASSDRRKDTVKRCCKGLICVSHHVTVDRCTTTKRVDDDTAWRENYGPFNCRCTYSPDRRCVTRHAMVSHAIISDRHRDHYITLLDRFSCTTPFY